jgi:hypothetical protein
VRSDESFLRARFVIITNLEFQKFSIVIRGRDFLFERWLDLVLNAQIGQVAIGSNVGVLQGQNYLAYKCKLKPPMLTSDLKKSSHSYLDHIIL